MVAVSGAVEPNVVPSDQPSIIYAYDRGDKIREIVRSTGSLTEAATTGNTKLRGDIVERDRTRSNPTERLPRLDLPGLDGLQRDDCGDDIPAFACEDCGHPVYVGRTCRCPRCERCWPAAVREKVIRYAGKLEGLRRKMYTSYNGRQNVDFNHVVASLPSVLVDSDTPRKRVVTILKTLLEEQWGIEGFAAIYHPYRIKQEYRKDQYEHDGEPGQGDMTWKDVLNADDPTQYIKFEPHFHLFFPATRMSFDYNVAEAVHEQSGWVFHRITKSGENDNRSVCDFDDLVHQLTYCMSHAGVRSVANRSELASSMKGDLHNCYIPDDVEDQANAIVADAAPKLLGYNFVNTSDTACDAEIEEQSGAETSRSGSSPNRSGGHDTRSLDATATPGFRPGESPDAWDSRSTASGGRQPARQPDAPDTSPDDHEADDNANTRVCGGGLVPMTQADALLSDPDWCASAQYLDALRTARDEWDRLRDEQTEENDPPPDTDIT